MPAALHTVRDACKAFLRRVKADIEQPDGIAVPLGSGCCLRRAEAGQRGFLRKGNAFVQAIVNAPDRHFAALKRADACKRRDAVNVHDHTQIIALRPQNTGQTALSRTVYAADDGIDFHHASPSFFSSYSSISPG